MSRAGVIVTSAEAAVFEWTGKAGTPVFKQISWLVQERMKALERENRELRQANEILRKASAYFAQAELDRRGK